MATSITIGDLPRETYDALTARAALHGRSLHDYLRSFLIDLAAKPSIDELMDRIAARKRVAGIELSAETILEHLRADRA
jgi:plasmid stability protein